MTIEKFNSQLETQEEFEQFDRVCKTMTTENIRVPMAGDWYVWDTGGGPGNRQLKSENSEPVSVNE